MKRDSYKHEGIKLAEEFLEKLYSGEIVEACRPNKGKEYTGGYEELDLNEYKEFLTSYTYKDLFTNQEIEYGQY